MNPHLQLILDKINQEDNLTADQKMSLIKAVKDADKNAGMLQFKLERIEKDRNTLKVMLGESIEDLQKKTKAIEEKKHELEIEASLERVRTQVMSMHRSEELIEVCKTLLTELQTLGFQNIRNTQIAIANDDKGSYMSYDYYTNDKFYVGELYYNSHPLIKSLAIKMRENKAEFINISVTGAELDDWRKYLKSLIQRPAPKLDAATSLNYYYYSIGPGGLGFCAYTPLNDEEMNLLKRFKNVFDLAYRRYADVAKAEAQAREAQIETALERIRARTMAMQKSDELPETSYLLFQQLKELGETAAQLSIGIIKEEKGFVELSATIHGSQILQTYDVPMDEPFVMKKALKAWKAKERSLVVELKSKELKDYNNWRNSFLGKKIVFPEEQWIINIIYFSKGFLSFSSDKQIPEETIQLLERFAGVFDQTYTRFLDLQKSEAQAKESQIQLALERVRARTMAMQKSDELPDAALLLSTQVKELGVQLWSTSFQPWDNDRKAVTAWTALKDIMLEPIKIPATEDSLMINISDAAKKGELLYVEEMGGKVLENHLKYMNSLPGVKEEFGKVVDAGFSFPTFNIFHAAYFSTGFILFITEKPCPEAHDIFKRFAKVFEQTYTRFLDLKQAEAQARESQIQLALERVRARTMAMQKSDELAEAASLLFTQIADLGTNSWSSGFIIFQPDELSINSWMSKPDGSMGVPFNIPVTEDPFFIKIYEAYKRGEEFFVMESGGKELAETYRYMFGLPGAAKALGAIEDIGFQMPTFQITHCTFFPQGFLMFITYEPCSEMWDIFKRFGKVFEQTYTRFLDLQKAEAQTREAKIEAALEKVRSRSLAVHKSDEFKEVIKVVFERLQELEIPMTSASINVFIEESKDTAAFICGFGKDGLTVSHIRLIYFDHPIANDRYNAHKNGLDFFTKTYSVEEKDSFFEYEFEVSDLKHIPADIKKMVMESQHYTCSVAFAKNSMIVVNDFEGKLLSPKEIDIVKRFSKVFEQAYIRFLDLKKAEAQAREAQIELGLERVRARAMAMQKSDELKELIGTVFIELTKLDLVLTRCLIMIYDPQSNASTWWMANSEAPTDPIGLYVKYHEQPPYLAYLQAWQERKYKWQYILEGKTKVEWDDFIFTETELSHLPDFVIAGMKAPDTVYLNSSFNSFGNLTLATLEPLSNEHFDILLRFAKVFDLTYTRFNDLQKAEAQAREAQIELGLERVRARAMAMQKSNELSELVDTVFKELTKLDFALTWCIINIIDEPSMSNTVWAANPDINMPPESYHMLFEDYPFHHAMMKGWKERKTKYVYTLEGQEKKIYDEYLFNETEFRRVPEEAQAASRAMEKYVVTFSFSNFGGLQTVGDVPLSDANLDILSRFGKVFDLTYTRFNDLKQAEAQAREAKIEAALEKVRSRTMAMQRSAELAEVATVLFQQVKALGVPQWTCGFSIFEIDDKEFTWYPGGPDGEILPPCKIPLTEHPVFISFNESRKRGDELYIYEKTGEEQTDHYRYMCSLPVIGEYMQSRLDAGEVIPAFQIDHLANFSHGNLIFITYEHFPEMHDVFKRFAKVFDQTYTRFLDLQKAEAQATEAKIEAALERVRSRTMAMHQTSELQEVIHTVHKELLNLSLSIDGGSFVVINDDVDPELRCWGSGGTANTSEEVQVPHFNMPFCTNLIKGIKRGPGFFTEEFSQKEKEKYFTKLFEHKPWSDLSSEQKKETLSSLGGYTRSVAVSKYTTIFIINHRGRIFTEAENDILKRFAKVFEQTYTRFLDLQKAEANAREAQIEASLERVRAKAMAMHKTEDLNPAVATVFEELEKLDLGVLRCGISVLDKEKRTGDIWVTTITDHGSAVQVSGDESFDIHPLLHGAFEAWLRREDFSYLLKGDDLTQYYKAVQAANFQLPDSQVLSSETEFKQQYCFATTYQAGGLFAFRETEFPAEAKTVMKRFAGVFDLTYKRFLDLQKAEANAREAQIQLALERVRARTMAMHSSEDVTSATETMFDELKKLGIDNLRCGIANIHHNSTFDVFGVTNLAKGNTMSGFGLFGMDEHPIWQRWFENWNNKEEVFIAYIAGQEKEEYFNNINNHHNYLPQEIIDFPDSFFEAYYFEQGSVWTYSLLEHSEKEKAIMKRFATSFSLTFRRYQDLQKAEAQVKEATIEAALEKVRGKAMAMHNSNDLTATASLVFTELRKLGINPMRCGVGMLNKENRKSLLYTAIASEEGDSLSQIGWVLLDTNPVLKSIYDHWVLGEDYFPVLTKEMLKAYYEHLKSGFEVPVGQTEYEHHGYFLPFSEGVFYGWAEKPFTESEIKILNRFASVIDLTFRRYIELQKSEANAREAVKQAALDRVRAEIASMRTISDLERITPLIWNELTILGVPFIRCGVFLMDDSQKLIHTFLSTPDGKAIAAFHLPYDTPGNFAEVVKHWRNKHKFIDHWGQPEFITMADTLVKQGAISKREQYLNTLPEGGFYLHFLPFLQGMLYVANTTQLANEELTLIQSVADAFSTAYARYEDFNKLEAAKQQVEKTLTDLKQTQQQLVQSEKMASLGEMTAGIAHEIQNPLNFVNNFSEVSKELLDEMKTELDIGNTADAKDIADDVIRNLEKINHHGKRADAIVKSMLQHSRSSSGKKEPTDINGLADEYLRLAYHGLRAKDKSFNAKFETEFDNSIGKVNIISQDIGRVLVNLINNAFYAVSEKKKQEANGYEPIVTVLTKKTNDKIEIMVKDNGNGIPQKVLDKIFQPFFTTKPTGQGTGLGLSLSYDIITKGHGGELKVETKEKEGTIFIVQLPL